MIQIAVCDDENVVINQIESLLLLICNRKGMKADIDAFNSGNTLEKEIISGTRYDLIFLDIQMDNGDGITVAKNIRKVDENALLIYVSGYDKYLMELFRLDVFGFVKKPIDEMVFENLFLEAYQKICSKNFYYSFRYKSQEFKILCRDILYFESSGRQVKVHCNDGTLKVFNGKLSDVEAEIQKGKNPFLRIHQSYLVNYFLIRSRSKKEIVLVNDERLSISEDRQKNFSLEYGKLLRGEIDV